MQALFSFLKSKQFFLQLGIILALIFLVLFVTVRGLSSYTDHGNFVTVPDFRNQQVAGLNEFVKDKNVSYLVIDSLYDPKEKPGVVIRQDPEPEAKVKHNRIVYLYVTGMVAPQITMPKLIDRSERQARFIIETYGLKVGQIREEKADCNGCVLAQIVKGKEIAPGAAVKKGSVVNLVVGKKANYLGAQNDSTTMENEQEELND